MLIRIGDAVAMAEEALEVLDLDVDLDMEDMDVDTMEVTSANQHVIK